MDLKGLPVQGIQQGGVIGMPFMCDDPAGKPLDSIQCSLISGVVRIPHNTTVIQFGKDSYCDRLHDELGVMLDTAFGGQDL